MRHISKGITGSKGSELKGRRIILCISGSVGAIKSPEIARELMRHGADVRCVMSGAGRRMISPELMRWASGNSVVTDLTGDAEHIGLIGERGEKADLVLVAPATANTISKAAYGIDDTPVTSVLIAALGAGIPVIFVPAMHMSMYGHAAVRENIEKLEGMGAEFIVKKPEEGKVKIAEVGDIASEVISKLYRRDLAGRRFVVTAGATREFIDDVRFVSSPSSGKMGVEVAKEAYLRGADVLLIHGHVDIPIPGYLKSKQVTSTSEMREAVLSNLKDCDALILAAAVSDFVPERRRGKVPSNKELRIRWRVLPKVSDEVKRRSKTVKLVLFKAESNVSDSELARIAKEKLKKSGAELIVANDVSREGAGFGSDTNEVLIIDRRGIVRKEKGEKRLISKKLIDYISRLF